MVALRADLKVGATVVTKVARMVALRVVAMDALRANN